MPRITVSQETYDLLQDHARQRGEPLGVVALAAVQGLAERDRVFALHQETLAVRETANAELASLRVNAADLEEQSASLRVRAADLEEQSASLRLSAADLQEQTEALRSSHRQVLIALKRHHAMANIELPEDLAYALRVEEDRCASNHATPKTFWDVVLSDVPPWDTYVPPAPAPPAPSTWPMPFDPDRPDAAAHRIHQHIIRAAIDTIERAPVDSQHRIAREQAFLLANLVPPLTVSTIRGAITTAAPDDLGNEFTAVERREEAREARRGAATA